MAPKYTAYTYIIIYFINYVKTLPDFTDHCAETVNSTVNRVEFFAVECLIFPMESLFKIIEKFYGRVGCKNFQTW